MYSCICKSYGIYIYIHIHYRRVLKVDLPGVRGYDARAYFNRVKWDTKLPCHEYKPALYMYCLYTKIIYMHMHTHHILI